MDYNVEQSPDMNQQPQHLNSGRPSGIKDKRRMLTIAAIAAGVLVVVALLFFFLVKGKDEDTKNENSQNSAASSEESSEPTMPEAEAAQPVVYKSTKLNIEITHRKDWKLEESDDRNMLTVTSPKVTYQTKEGASTQGVFTLRFSLGATEGEQETLDTVKAVKDSVVIAYDAPTESQRFYTNVSYVGENEAFQFMVVTGSQALKVGNSLGLIVDEGEFLIAGGFGTDSQQSLSFDPADPATIEGNIGYEQALAIVKSLKVY